MSLAVDMLLVVTGTGLAPLRAIAKAALKAKHKGKITLLHGGLDDQDLYYVSELQALALKEDNFYYDNCVLNESILFEQITVDNKMQQYLQAPNTARLYICGPADTTSKLKLKAFLKGVPSSAILSDSFL